MKSKPLTEKQQLRNKKQRLEKLKFKLMTQIEELEKIEGSIYRRKRTLNHKLIDVKEALNEIPNI